MSYAKGDGAYDADVTGEHHELATEGGREAYRMLRVVHKGQNQAAPNGSVCICPMCDTQFTKKHPKQAFCNKDGKHRCKTQYHNTVDEKRRQRSLEWSANRY
jgi:hypothetical protein